MKKSLLLLTLGVLLVSCGGGAPSSETPKDTSSIRIISPTGAPTLALYNKVNQLTTNSTPTNVAAQLLADNYDVVVFDFYNGLKSQKANNGHYKLARILTAGNLYLVGINHNSEPSSGHKIVSFGEGLLPDLAFKELYGNSGAITSYVSGVQDIAPILKTGKYAGEDIDYVVIAEPVLTSTLATIEDTSIYTKFSIREKWESVKGEGHIIPQAGLFFNMNSYNNNEATYNQFLKELDNDISGALINPSLIKSSFELVGDLDAQKAKFGIPAAMAYKVTQNGNGVGLVEEYNKLVITNFLEDINKSSEDYSSYIL